MTYVNHHFKCQFRDCVTHSAYIRIKKKWVKIGEYNSLCRELTVTNSVREKPSFDKHLDLEMMFDQMCK